MHNAMEQLIDYPFTPVKSLPSQPNVLGALSRVCPGSVQGALKNNRNDFSRRSGWSGCPGSNPHPHICAHAHTRALSSDNILLEIKKSMVTLTTPMESGGAASLTLDTALATP